jgi:hypothetical protein
VIWLQALICFGIWITYGVIQSRRSAQIRTQFTQMSRGARSRNGAFLMLGGGALLFGCLILCYVTGGLTPNGFKVWAWLLFAICGLAFVHAQTMAMAMLVSLMYDGVTSQGDSSSDQQKSESK